MTRIVVASQFYPSAGVDYYLREATLLDVKIDPRFFGRVDRPAGQIIDQIAMRDNNLVPVALFICKRFDVGSEGFLRLPLALLHKLRRNVGEMGFKTRRHTEDT